VAAALVLWFGLIYALGATGVLHSPATALPLPLLLGFTLPILFFLALYGTVARFREFVLAADLRLATGMQAWRFAGFGFLALYAYGLLPGAFAWPAGLGDIAIGMTAPWVVAALIQRPGFVTSKGFVAWNLLGMLDLLVAVGSGALARLASSGGGVTTELMGTLPLVLIPCYFVPIFFMLHLTALYQARHGARAEAVAAIDGGVG
jgi:hypothetical protein